MDSEIKRKSIPNLFGSLHRIPRTDPTLTKEGYSADAKAVGDILRGEQRAVNFSYDSNGNGLEATTIQEALDELKANSDVLTEKVDDVETNVDGLEEYLKKTPTNGQYFGFSTYSGNQTTGVFVPLDKYILENYTIAAVDKIHFSGIVEGYTADEVTVKANGVLVGHTFESAQAALNAIRATNSVNGTVRLAFTPK